MSEITSKNDGRYCLTCGINVRNTCPIGQVTEGEPIPCEPERNLHEDLRICEQATPGPWEIADTTDGYVLLDADGRELAFCDSIERADDARFIANAPDTRGTELGTGEGW